MNRVGKFIISIIICEGIGIIGSLFTFSEITTWYATLNKPFFSPPNFVFGPVWTTLYALIGISIVLVLEKASKKKKKMIIALFVLQLVLNFLWSVVFFGGHEVLLAFLVILALWGSIAGLIIMFKRISVPAAFLLVPYLLWVSFATLLNLAIVLLN
jgi:tryptophan-rich sensory protein